MRAFFPMSLAVKALTLSRHMVRLRPFFSVFSKVAIVVGPATASSRFKLPPFNSGFSPFHMFKTGVLCPPTHDFPFCLKLSPLES